MNKVYLESVWCMIIHWSILWNISYLQSIGLAFALKCHDWNIPYKHTTCVPRWNDVRFNVDYTRCVRRVEYEGSLHYIVDLFYFLMTFFKCNPSVSLFNWTFVQLNSVPKRICVEMLYYSLGFQIFIPGNGIDILNLRTDRRQNKWMKMIKQTKKEFPLHYKTRLSIIFLLIVGKIQYVSCQFFLLIHTPIGI